MWHLVRSCFVMIFAIVLFAISLGETVLAADDIGGPGAEASSATSPSSNWVQLSNGEKHWYFFKDEGDNTNIEVRMEVIPGDRAIFEVWTSEQLRKWYSGEEFSPVGAGTKNKHLNDDLFWTGNFVSSDVYYVIVVSRNFGPSNYKLTISGEDVSFPQVLDKQLINADVEGEELALEIEDAIDPVLDAGVDPAQLISDQNISGADAAASVESPGSHADRPLAPLGKWTEIKQGETHWYSFRDEGDDSNIEAALNASPDNGATFEVWTPGQLRQWQDGDQFSPVGAGAKNQFKKADLFWSGSFVRSGNYFIVVRHSGLVVGSTYYNLIVTGDDVSY